MDELDEKDRTLCGCMGLGWWGEEVGGACLEISG